MPTLTPFRSPARDVSGLLAPAERRALAWLAARMPARVQPDHLTVLGLAAMALAGLGYALVRRDASWIHLVNLSLALNWFGDSLDGSLARFRDRQRPRFGFYVDHMVDIFGAFLLLAGLWASGLMSERVALGLVIAYYALNIHIYLATYTRGVFKISFGPVGGTELRVLLALLNLAVIAYPSLTLGSAAYLTFDVLGVLGIVGMVGTLLVATAKNTAELYEAERLP